MHRTLLICLGLSLLPSASLAQTAEAERNLLRARVKLLERRTDELEARLQRLEAVGVAPREEAPEPGAQKNDGAASAAPTKGTRTKPFDLRPVARLRHGDRIFDLEWKPGSTSLATAGSERDLRVWNGQTGEQEILIPVEAAAVDLSWRGDGATLAAALGGRGQGLMVWDLSRRRFSARKSKAGKKAYAVLTTEKAAPNRPEFQKIAYAPKGKKLLYSLNLRFDPEHLVLSDDGLVKEQQVIARPHNFVIEVVGWSPDGSQIAVAGGKAIHIWDGGLKEERIRLSLQGNVLDLAWSPDGSTLASSDESGEINVWESATGRHIGRLTLPLADPLAFDPLGRFLVVGGDGALVLITPDGTRTLASYPLERRAPRYISRFLQDKKEGRIRKTRLEIQTPYVLAFKDDGSHLAVAEASGEVVVYRITKTE